MHGLTPQHLDIVLDLADILNYTEHIGYLKRRGKDSRDTYCNKPSFLNGIQRRYELLQSYSVSDGEWTSMKHWRNCTARTQPKYLEENLYQDHFTYKNPWWTNKSDTGQTCGPLTCWNLSITDLLSEHSSRHLCRILRTFLLVKTGGTRVQARVCAWCVRV